MKFRNMSFLFLVCLISKVNFIHRRTREELDIIHFHRCDHEGCIKYWVLKYNASTYMEVHAQTVHLHQVLTVTRMSQINHYQDESNYALKRIDGKICRLQIIHILFLIICIIFGNRFVDLKQIIIFKLSTFCWWFIILVILWWFMQRIPITCM